jgi:hypothetical protein
LAKNGWLKALECRGDTVSLYDRFAETKEQGFREHFIAPLLIKLGFINISNKHGSQEFGKDYVFSEIDGFGHYRHMVVQAKHEKVLKQGPKIDVLLSQVRQAFSVAYSLPTVPHEKRRVSAVYVFNTGTIPDGAQTQIRDGLDLALRTNVYFFDGGQLEILDNSKTQQYNSAVRRRLLALVVELNINASIALKQRRNLDAADDDIIWDVREFFTGGIEDFVSSPVAPEHLKLDDLVHLWQRYGQIKAVIRKYYNGHLPLGTQLRGYELKMLKDLCDDTIARTEALLGSIANALNSLPDIVI